eukprot:SAG22_NODE_22276_length_232_cov_3.436090_1_plen_72_part_01
MESALRLHQLLPQCNVLLTQSNDCVARLDEILRFSFQIFNAFIAPPPHLGGGLRHRTCAPLALALPSADRV